MILKRGKKLKNEKILKICQEYCTGCGLCASVNETKFKKDNKGFLYPQLEVRDIDLCKVVCPAAGNAVNNHLDGTTWGKFISCYLGWSSDETIRFEASSGGIITALCIFLLEEKFVDAIIQVKRDFENQMKTVTVVNTSEKEILKCTGSRYTTSEPLMKIKTLIEKDKKYAFVGKPCDVSALKMLQLSKKERWTDQIEYMFSFFCAGQPSEKANKKLLNELGCNTVKDIKDFSYRGNGWPGFATVSLKNGKKAKMEYEKSWMTILGRDVRKCCRFCADGIGEMADISCGDAWHLTADGKPDFKEAAGRNVIFSRTEKGDILLQKLINKKKITVEKFDPEIDKLRRSQPYHYNRKASLSSLKLAMKLCRREFPLYSNKKLSKFAQNYPVKDKVLRFAGTIKRVWSKSI